MRRKTIFALAAAAILPLVVAGASAQGTLRPDNEQLGKDLFFDTNLSTPPGQACAACHGPEVGYTGPDANIILAGRSMKVPCRVDSATASHLLLPMPATARSCILMGRNGWVACSGTAGPPAGPSATRWLNRPRVPS